MYPTPVRKLRFQVAALACIAAGIYILVPALDGKHPFVRLAEFLFFVFAAASMINQATKTVTLDGQSIELRSALSRPRKLTLDQVSHVRSLSARGGVMMFFKPLNGGQRPLTFDLNNYSATDQEAICAFAGHCPSIPQTPLRTALGMVAALLLVLAVIAVTAGFVFAYHRWNNHALGH